MQVDLISIIIPTYNRAHLISDTLNSIISQSYINWECLVIDDGSSDNTEKVLASYIKADNRFKYYKRPSNRLKGANSCRNYGLEMSKGKYINWFDSDDLMNVDCLFSKIKFLKKNKLDFVVSKTKFFYPNSKKVKPNYNLLKEQVTLSNFVCNNQFWLTLDGLFNKETIGNVRWNESLKSGQEYNFISKYLSLKKRGLFIDEYLALARVHETSIHSKQNKSQKAFSLNKYLVYLKTYLDLKETGVFNKNNNEIKIQLFKSLMSHSYDLKLHNYSIPNTSLLFRELFIEKGIVKTIAFMVSLITAKFFNKGYDLMNYARN